MICLKTMYSPQAITTSRTNTMMKAVRPPRRRPSDSMVFVVVVAAPRAFGLGTVQPSAHRDTLCDRRLTWSGRRKRSDRSSFLKQLSTV